MTHFCSVMNNGLFADGHVFAAQVMFNSEMWQIVVESRLNIY